MSCFSCPICGDILYETPDLIRENKIHKSSKRHPAPTFGQLGRVIHPFEFDLNTNRPERGRRIFKECVTPKSTVIAKCGHFFHKACIDKYMRAYRLVSRLSVTECPICFQVLYLPFRNPVDFEASEDFGENIEVKCKIFNAVHGELQDQLRDVKVKLEDIQDKIKEAERLYKSLNPRGENVPTDNEEALPPPDYTPNNQYSSKKSSLIAKPSKSRRKRSPIDIFAGPRLRAMYTDPSCRIAAFNNRLKMKAENKKK